MHAGPFAEQRIRLFDHQDRIQALGPFEQLAEEELVSSGVMAGCCWTWTATHGRGFPGIAWPIFASYKAARREPSPYHFEPFLMA